MSNSAPVTPFVSLARVSSNGASVAAASPPGNAKGRESNCLPQARVKTIMKSSPDVDTVSQETLFLVTRATELFIMYLSKLASRHGDDDDVSYSDLAAVVQKKDSMEFLHDIVPRKIKYREYLKMMEEDKDKSDDDIF